MAASPLICGLLCVALLASVAAKDTTISEVKNQKSQQTENNHSELKNSTLYIAFANDPFGQSIKFTAKAKSGQKIETRDEKALAPEQRSKRGIFHLYNMVHCATGCNPLIYKGYGCYCGFLGSGYEVDGIDRCCKIHDWCYETAACPAFMTYLIPYYWRCYENRPYCAINNEDLSAFGTCAQRLCECDRMFASCLAEYPCPSTRHECRSSGWRLLQSAFLL